MKMQTLFFSLFSVVMMACSHQETIKEEAPKTEENVLQTEETVQFEAIPKEVMESFWNEATGIEATVYTNGASFSLWDKKSIQAFIELFQTETPTSNTKKQIGHIMLLKDGDQLALLNVYEIEGKVFGRYDNEGKSYYSILTGKGSDMFLNMVIEQKE